MWHPQQGSRYGKVFEFDNFLWPFVFVRKEIASMINRQSGYEKLARYGTQSTSRVSTRCALDTIGDARCIVYCRHTTADRQILNEYIQFAIDMFSS